MTIETIKPTFRRNHQGRPYILPPGAQKETTYTRMTTWVGALEDTYKLGEWQQRMVAIGLSKRADLLLSVAAHLDDKDHLNDVCVAAKDAAEASAKATIGTALHALAQQMDERTLDWNAVPDEYKPDLEAYFRATNTMFSHLWIEQPCVNDPYKVAGTPDRVSVYNGGDPAAPVERGDRVIMDLKTGSIEWGASKMAGQLAGYANSLVYNPETQARVSHQASTEWGVIVHLPAGQGVCTMYWIDLKRGWSDFQLCGQVRAVRAGDKMVEYMRPVSQAPTPPAATSKPLDPILAGIESANGADALTSLWRANHLAWTEAHSRAAEARLKQLAAS